jgi:hypothetical protein
VDARTRELLSVLTDARERLARPGNDFLRSSWRDREHALHEIDRLRTALRADFVPKRRALEILFAPTGDIQQVSASSGWAEAFLVLASRFDVAISKVYGERPS